MVLVYWVDDLVLVYPVIVNVNVKFQSYSTITQSA